VVARGRPNHRKRVVTLIFRWCGWWWWPEEGPTTENEHLHLFSGVMGGGGGQRKVLCLKTSGYARFQGGVVCVTADEPPCSDLSPTSEPTVALTVGGSGFMNHGWSVDRIKI